MGRRVEDPLAVRGEVAAGGATGAAGHQNGLLSCGERQPIDLVATVGRARRLKHQLAAVRRPVALGVLAAEGQLADLLQPDLLRMPQRTPRSVRIGGDRAADNPRRADQGEGAE